MHTNLQLVIAGAGAAGALAFLALGLTVTYRGSRVINFAHGAVATFSTYSYLWLFDHGMPMAVAAVVGVALGASIGAGFQWLVLRPIDDAPVLVKVVAHAGAAHRAPGGGGAVVRNDVPEPAAHHRAAPRGAPVR